MLKFLKAISKEIFFVGNFVKKPIKIVQIDPKWLLLGLNMYVF